MSHPARLCLTLAGLPALLAAALLLAPAPSMALGDGIPRPADRLNLPGGSRPDAGGVAERSRLLQERQDSRGELYDRRQETDQQGERSPTRRAQDPLPPSLGERLGREQEEQQRLERIERALD